MEVREGDRGATWGVFRFEPIKDSKNKVYHFTLLPEDEEADLSAWAPFVAMRSTLGAFSTWGNGHTPTPDPIDFRSTFANLSTIAIGVDGLDPAAAHTYLELFELPEDGGEPILRRQGNLHHVAPVAAGYAFFSFDPIAESRYRQYRAILHVPANARVMRNKDHASQPDGVTALTYHGVGKPSPGLIGLTKSRWIQPNRDLIFRAFGEDGVYSNWTKVEERGAKGRFIWALLVWGAAAAGALLVMARALRA